MYNRLKQIKLQALFYEQFKCFYYEFQPPTQYLNDLYRMPTICSHTWSAAKRYDCLI